MSESKNLQRLTKPEIPRKLRNTRLYNNDKSTIHLPRQDKRVDCISPQRGAVSGQITAYKKVRYYGIATNEVLEPKI